MPAERTGQTDGADGPGAPVVLLTTPGAPSALLIAFLRALGYIIRETPSDSVAERGPAGAPTLAPGEVLVASWPFSRELAEHLALRGSRIMLLIRDPRDAWCTLAAGDPQGRVAPDDPPEAASEMEQPCITGDASSQAGGERLGAFRGWREWPGILVVRYEAICPPGLGGEETVQLRTLIELAARLGWHGSGFRLTRAILATHSSGLRVGPADDVGAWQRRLAADAQASAQAALHDEAIAWGYETAPTAPQAAPQGAVGGLLSALANEHDAVVGTMQGRIVGARTELRRVEEAARGLQDKLAAERRRFRILRGSITRLRAWKARIGL